MIEVRKIFLPENKVLVEIPPKEEVVGGFYMPESNRTENLKGSVVSVAENLKESTKGMEKFIARHDAGVEIEVDALHPIFDENSRAGYTYRVIDIKDILIMW